MYEKAKAQLMSAPEAILVYEPKRVAVKDLRWEKDLDITELEIAAKELGVGYMYRLWVGTKEGGCYQKIYMFGNEEQIRAFLGPVAEHNSLEDCGHDSERGLAWGSVNKPKKILSAD